MCSAGFCYCLLQILQIISESKLSEVVHFKTSQRSHSLERAQEINFFPQWSGEHSRTQSPSFLDHVVGYKLSRVALGTRMLLYLLHRESLAGLVLLRC